MADPIDSIRVTINNIEYRFAHKTRTGAQILKKAGFEPAHYDLFQVVKGESVAIGPDQAVKLKNKDRFRAIPKDITLG